MARAQHIRKVYVNGDGETSRSAKPGTVLRFEMFGTAKDDDGKPVVIDTFDVDVAKLGQDMLECAMRHGVSQKLGDNIAGIETKVTKSQDTEDPLPTFDVETGYAPAIRAILESQWEDLAGGVWVSESEGGGGSGNVTMLLEAVQAAFAKEGQELSEKQVKAFREQLADKDAAKAIKSNPQVAAEYQAIQAKRAQERAKAAAAKAKEAGKAEGGGLSALLGS